MVSSYATEGRKEAPVICPVQAGWQANPLAYSPLDTPHLDPIKAMDSWGVWKGSKPRPDGGFGKYVIDPVKFESERVAEAGGFRWSRPENHISNTRARAIAEELTHKTGGLCGTTFIPNPAGDVVILDFDKVFDPETGELLKPWALNIVGEIGSYAESSASGRGLRVVVYGNLGRPGGRFSERRRVILPWTWIVSPARQSSVSKRVLSRTLCLARHVAHCHIFP